MSARIPIRVPTMPVDAPMPRPPDADFGSIVRWARDITVAIGNLRREILKPSTIRITKKADESRHSTTVVAADSELVLKLQSYRRYRVRGVVWFSTQATPDFKYSLIGLSGAGRVWRHSCAGGATPASIPIDASLPANQTLAGTGVEGILAFEALLWCGEAEDTFALHWAQGTSDNAPTIVRAGSYIDAVEF